MSIEGAAKELTKEIERLNREAERLTKLRDALHSGPAAAAAASAGLPAPKKKGAKKSASKAVPPPKKKRVLSPEGRKAIADATKRRWALKRKADAAAAK